MRIRFVEENMATHEMALVMRAIEWVAARLEVWEAGEGPDYPACAWCENCLADAEKDVCAGCGLGSCQGCRFGIGGEAWCALCGVRRLGLVCVGEGPFAGN